MIAMKKRQKRKPSRLVEPVGIDALKFDIANVAKAASDLRAYVDQLAKEGQTVVYCEARGLPAMAETIANVQASIVRNLFKKRAE